MKTLDLGLVPTSELIEELKSRYDVLVGYGASEDPYQNEMTVYEYIMKGPLYALIGMLELLKASELNDFVMRKRPIDCEESD